MDLSAGGWQLPRKLGLYDPFNVLGSIFVMHVQPLAGLALWQLELQTLARQAAQTLQALKTSGFPDFGDLEITHLADRPGRWTTPNIAHSVGS